MGTLVSSPRFPHASAPLARVQPPSRLAGPRWSLAFLGILAYLVVEYTRLAAMYPALLPLHVGKVVVVAAVLGLLLEPFRALRQPSSSQTVKAAMALMLFLVFLSTLGAPYQQVAWDGWFDALRWGLIFLVISQVVSSQWRVRAFVVVWLLLNFKLAQFAIRSFLAAKAVGISDSMLASHGMGTGSTGFFSNGSDFGIAMVVAWAVTGSLLFASLRTRWRVLLLALFSIFLVAILICGSRGAVVGAAAVTLAALKVTPRPKMAFLVMAFFFGVGIFLVYTDANKDRMRSAWNWEQDATASGRVTLWKDGMKMLRDHPLLGVGPKNFAPVRVRANPDSSANEQGTGTVAHSIYITALSELGLLGSSCMLLLWILYLRANSLTRKRLLSLGPEQRSSFEYCLAFGLDLALLGYLVSGAFASVLWYPNFWILLALTVGLHTACGRREEAAAASPIVLRKQPEPAFGSP